MFFILTEELSFTVPLKIFMINSCKSLISLALTAMRDISQTLGHLSSLNLLLLDQSKLLALENNFCKISIKKNSAICV
jgi:hypothetical protein